MQQASRLKSFEGNEFRYISVLLNGRQPAEMVEEKYKWLIFLVNFEMRQNVASRKPGVNKNGEIDQSDDIRIHIKSDDQKK